MQKRIDNIYIAGFMACGKTVVGQCLAELLDRPFVDTDARIAQETGLSITDIFQIHGEAHFRHLEKRCLQAIAGQNGQVVALGGGVVLDDVNWDLLRRSGRTIVLSFPAEILNERLKDVTDRPLLAGTEGQARLDCIRDLLTKRENAYRKADIFLHLNNDLPPDRIARMMAALLEEMP